MRNTENIIQDDNMKNVMVIYPPGGSYQRGEDRCQININASVSNALRACNDLGYIAAGLKGKYNVFLKDYPAENLHFSDMTKDISDFNPDFVFISTTNASIFEDISVIKHIKEIKNDVHVILKGAVFFNPDPDIFEEADFSQIDFLVGGESEFIVPVLIDRFYNGGNYSDIEGICYKDNNKWKVNKVITLNEDLDSLPFPDRSLMKNELYINPDTNRPLATISVSRGCPSSCIYCLSPVISGRKVRFRSMESVFEEISECFNKYGIKDFFFKADTFTMDKTRVVKLCDLILNSPLKGKINWVANSRVNTIDEEMLIKMKEAGCSLIAFGLESGSDESLKLMKKGTTVQQNEAAVKLVKKHGLKVFGFYLVGFPWETKEHLKMTEKLMFKLNTDFIELSVATPFKGSQLYSMLFNELDGGKKVLGKDSFKYMTLGTKYLTKKDLDDFRRKVLLKYHLRPSYILKKIFNKNLTPALLFNYITYGFRLIKNNIIRKRYID